MENHAHHPLEIIYANIILLIIVSSCPHSSRVLNDQLLTRGEITLWFCDYLVYGNGYLYISTTLGGFLRSDFRKNDESIKYQVDSTLNPPFRFNKPCNNVVICRKRLSVRIMDKGNLGIYHFSYKDWQMKKTSLKTGIKLGGWISQYPSYDHKTFQNIITERISSDCRLGFDHVRLPVDYR
jgi:hypothetical protein